ncbi:MAG: DNA/RNA nuclease SfsA [Hominimerdicola sp.]
MKYKNIKKAVFCKRPNRFIAICEVNGCEEVVHVKNTGRCRELLIKGATVFLEENNSPARKTKYDLISVVKDGRLINMDSQSPNKVFGEWAKSGKFVPDITMIKPECKYLNSRFDFYIETQHKKIFVEVKGVTLENNGVVMFPDAPTERGLKHITELIDAKKNGYEAYVFFVIQMENVKYFTPNAVTHKAFADKLKECRSAGVNILAYDCIVTEDSISINKQVSVNLEE